MVSSRKHNYRIKKFSDLKIGDELTVRSKKWYEENRDQRGYVEPFSDQDAFIEDMVNLAGKKVHVKTIHETDNYREMIRVEENNYQWHPWMFEEFEFPS